MWRRCSLLFYFSAFLLVCSFAFLLLSFLASLFSASLLFCFMSFRLLCFAAFLLLCFSSSTCSFSAVMCVHDMSIRTKIRKPFPYVVFPLAGFIKLEWTCVSICNKQIPKLTNSHIYGNLLNYDKSFFEQF